jgi:hypothetical protein
MHTLCVAVYALTAFKSQAVSGVPPCSTQTHRRFTLLGRSGFFCPDAAVAPVTRTSVATRPISRDFTLKFSFLG